jgi:phytoene dehydrogenase-like protein
MPRESYDVVVLGDELAGLVAATLCARRGLRVLLGQVAPRRTSYAIAGIRLPTEPLLLAGLGGTAARRVLDELHFFHLIKRKLRPSTPALQLTSPDARMDLDADDAAIARVAARELGDASRFAAQLEQAAALSRGVDRVVEGTPVVPPIGFWDRREIGKVAGSIADDAAAWHADLGDGPGALLAALPGALATGAPPDGVGPLAAARALDLLRQGAPRLVGDHETLREIFLDKFASHSGEVRTVEPAAITTSWGKANGVALVGGDELGAGHVIAACPIDALSPWLDGRAAKKLAELTPGTEPAGYRYTLHLVMDAIGVPEGMGGLLLALRDPAASAIGGNAIALHVAPPDEQARVVVTAQAIAPPPAGRDLEQVLAEVRAEVRRGIERVMPFSAGHIRLAHSPNQAAPAEGVDVELAVVAPPRPLWRARDGGALGLAALDYATGVKGLTLASSQILPGLGIEGELLAGWSAARVACEASGKKRDFLQGELKTG